MCVVSWGVTGHPLIQLNTDWYGGGEGARSTLVEWGRG